MSSQLNVTTEQTTTHAVVAAVGDIGFEEATPFRAAVRRSVELGRPKTIIDLSGVDFMNTPGIAVLVEALQTTRRLKTRLLLCGVGERVLAVLDIAKLTRVFEVRATRQAAIDE